MTKDSKKSATRPKRTKSEVQQEFAEIREEVDSGGPRDAKAMQLGQLQEQSIREAVDGVSVEQVVQKISGLGLEVSRALAVLSEKMSQEVVLLGSVRAAVALEREELQRLHKIDIAATALDQLVQDYATREQHLESEIAGRRQSWQTEIEETERERKEQEDALKKQRQREVEDYEYKKALDRKKAQDKYEEELRLRDRKNQEQQTALEKSWQEREARIKEQEAEMARLVKEAAEFPACLAKEIEVARSQGRQEAEGRLEQRLLVLEKDAETERRLAQMQVKSLEDALARSATQMAMLEKQLAEAKQQVQDIAVKAIEGASGARALSHINQIAMEQAKNRPQG